MTVYGWLLAPAGAIKTVAIRIEAPSAKPSLRIRWILLRACGAALVGCAGQATPRHDEGTPGDR
jgi:hypothetical protein